MILVLTILKKTKRMSLYRCRKVISYRIPIKIQTRLHLLRWRLGCLLMLLIVLNSGEKGKVINQGSVYKIVLMIIILEMINTWRLKCIIIRFLSKGIQGTLRNWIAKKTTKTVKRRKQNALLANITSSICRLKSHVWIETKEVNIKIVAKGSKYCM